MSTVVNAPVKRAGKKRRPASRRGPKKVYLAERTYREMRERIYTGVYRPGQHLKEEVLVEELGASRSVIRQALTQLTTEGLLLDRPKKGKFVSEFTEDMIAKLVPIRIVLEQLAVKEAIRALTPEDEKELRSMATRLLQPDISLSEQDALDVALHRRIWQLAGNDELEKVLTRVVGPFHMVSNAVLLSPYYRRNAAAISVQQIFFERERHAAGHQPLVDAICRRSVPAAVKAVAEHISSNYYQSSFEDFSKKVGELLKRYVHEENELPA
ncbi:MAG: GntR family transcriptional regulator [Bryobacteraceae bacterium]